jgi:hypothetical protein
MGQLWVGRIVARPSWPRLRGLEALATKGKPPVTDPITAPCTKLEPKPFIIPLKNRLIAKYIVRNLSIDKQI